MKENSCTRLVISNHLLRFDAHNEQTGLNLDKKKVFTPFLLSYLGSFFEGAVLQWV